jgi:hypothetical protein
MESLLSKNLKNKFKINLKISKKIKNFKKLKNWIKEALYYCFFKKN